MFKKVFDLIYIVGIPDERFSKFAFKMGHYNQTDLEKYHNDTTAQAYVSESKNEKKNSFY